MLEKPSDRVGDGLALLRQDAERVEGARVAEVGEDVVGAMDVQRRPEQPSSVELGRAVRDSRD